MRLARGNVRPHQSGQKTPLSRIGRVRADIEPAKGGAEARMAVYQFQGSVDRLMRPLPIGLAALLDPTGWAETRLMLIGEGAMLKSELDGRQRFSADWVLRTYGPGLPPPE